MIVVRLAQFMVLVAIGVVLATNVAIIGLRLGQRSLRVIWLSALAGAVLAWLLVVVARLGIPFQLVFLQWQSVTGSLPAGGMTLDTLTTWFTSSPLILLDPISWSFALALSTLLLGVLLTAVSRLPGLDWRTWSGSLGLAAMGLMAIIAGNPLTIILTWTVFDLVEVIVWLVIVDDQAKRRNSVVIFGIRMAGVVILLCAALSAAQNGQVLDFGAIPAAISPWLVLAAGVRLGVVPFQTPFHTETPMRQGLGTMLRLSPQAVSLVLLTRTAAAGVSGFWLTFFLGLGLCMALFCAVAWMLSRDELSGRPYWLLATASMALIAAILGQPGACLAWGVTSLLTGGFVFLSGIRHRYLMALTVGAALGLTMLPYTPLWLNTLTYSAIWRLFQDWAAILMIGALLSIQALLVVGFLIHGMRKPEEHPEPERWIWLFYPPGLIGLLLTNYAWGWNNRMTYSNFIFADWLAGPLVCLLSIVFLVWRQRRPDIFAGPIILTTWKRSVLSRYFTYDWAKSLLKQLFQTGNYISRLLNGTLEGEGGILWAFLLLILIFSLVLQSDLPR